MVIEHTLKVNPKAKPVKQGQRTMSEERQKAAQSEVQKLLDAGVPRSSVSRVAGKCFHGAKEKREVANVHRLHNPQQGMSKGRMPIAAH